MARNIAAIEIGPEGPHDEEEGTMKKGVERILVIGAGVNGSICAVRLFEAGIDVTILARGARFAFIKEQGVIIDDPFRNARTVTKVPVIDALLPEDIYDYVLIVVRKNQVSELLPVLVRLRNPPPLAVVMS